MKKLVYILQRLQMEGTVLQSYFFKSPNLQSTIIGTSCYKITKRLKF